MANFLSDSYLQTILPEWQALLQGWALDGSLSAAAQEALVLDGTPDALQDLITLWGTGDFSAIPEIVLLSSAEMNGAMGAYAISTGIIYLNADWMEGATKDQVYAVLTEELGHHLDGLLNASDTSGDEGEYFARLLSRENLSDGQKDLMRVQSDSGSITSAGTQITVETAAIPVLRGNSLYTLKDGVTWHQGETYANSIGGHLASINDAKENTYLQTNFQRGWVGYTDELKEGEWLWTDGSTSTYTSWQVGQPDDARGIQDYAQVWDSSGKWDDAEDDTTESAIFFNKRAVIEVALKLSIDLPTSPTEGAGEFAVNIDLTAGTVAEYKYSLVTGAQVWYVVSGITQEDLESGYSLTGTGTINASGNIVLNGATTAGIKFALKDDDIAETEDFKITFYTADPSITTEVLEEVQLGALESIAVVDTGVPFEIGTITKDDPTIYISGISGSTGTSKIESVSIVKTVTGKGKKRVTKETPAYTTLATYSNPNGVDGITLNGGASANTIRASGVSGDPSRPAFNGQTILDGKLGTDIITGGSYRNWLVGGGIFSTPLITTTTAVDTLIGTAGALDVFDLRTSDFTGDAYSALNTGSARINNYSIDQDWIVLAGTQGSYTFTAVQTTTGSKRNKVTTTTGYQIFSGTELMATVNAASGTTLTGNAANDLQILYGQTGGPTDALFGGQQMFF